MGKSLLYGMNRSNHDFSQTDSLGKNIFTNAFPLALVQYMDQEMSFTIPEIRAVNSESGGVTTKHVAKSWAELIGTDPRSATFHFEKQFEGYNQYTHNGANKSDVVVCNGNEHVRPLEIKLVVTPTSQTATKPREKQSCEIVTRPSTVEQIAYSIAHSFGVDRRLELLDTINSALGHPHDYKWQDSIYMGERVDKFKDAATRIIQAGINLQTPLVLTALWRTKGQSPAFDDRAFDAFVWTDLAFLQLYLNSASKPKAKGKVSRPSRSLMWLISCLYEFAAQGTMNFDRTRSTMSFGFQTDKAGAFSGNKPLQFLRSSEFIHPRTSRYCIDQIISPEALDQLLPERRLDSAIALQHLISAAEKRGFEKAKRELLNESRYSPVQHSIDVDK